MRHLIREPQHLHIKHNIFINQSPKTMRTGTNHMESDNKFHQISDKKWLVTRAQKVIIQLERWRKVRIGG